MTKYFKVLLLSLVFLSNRLSSQDADETGKFIGTIYFDAYSEVGEANNRTAMEIQRIYFGYNYHYDSKLTAYFKLDIGSPENESAYSLIRRYAYFRNGGLRYKWNKFTFNVGLIDMFMFKTQEKYWGHRYVERSFMDRFRFGPSADIGFNFMYNSEKWIVDGGLYNGEGYKNLQFDNSYRLNLGLSRFLWKDFLLRVHLDYNEKFVHRYTLSGFVGYNHDDKWIFGAEYNYQANTGFQQDRNMFGYSLYGSWNINSKWQYFARFDMLNSTVLPDELVPWNLATDGSSIITGFQYRLHQKVLVSLNYRDWYPYPENLDNETFLYLNLEVKI